MQKKGLDKNKGGGFRKGYRGKCRVNRDYRPERVKEGGGIAQTGKVKPEKGGRIQSEG